MAVELVTSALIASSPALKKCGDWADSAAEALNFTLHSSQLERLLLTVVLVVERRPLFKGAPLTNEA